MTLSRGDDVRCEITKWGDQPHWGSRLSTSGADRTATGSASRRARTSTARASTYVAPYDQVGLVPHADLAQRGWMAAFHATGGPVQVVRRHRHPAGLGRSGACARSTWTSTSCAAPTAASGSTTRTSSPSTAWPSAIPANWCAPPARAATTCTVPSATRPPYDGTHLPWLDRLAALAGSPGQIAVNALPDSKSAPDYPPGRRRLRQLRRGQRLVRAGGARRAAAPTAGPRAAAPPA